MPQSQYSCDRSIVKGYTGTHAGKFCTYIPIVDDILRIMVLYGR